MRQMLGRIVLRRLEIIVLGADVAADLGRLRLGHVLAIEDVPPLRSGVGDASRPELQGRPDDWTKWYTDKTLIRGLHAEDALTAENKDTDLFNAFWLDEQSTKSGLFDARKHHEEYQEFLQSKHAKANLLTCSDCHMPHVVTAKPAVEAKATCTQCHGAQYDWQKIMPGRGRRRDNCSCAPTRSTRTRRARAA
jgi:hypothetical protein